MKKRILKEKNLLRDFKKELAYYNKRKEFDNYKFAFHFFIDSTLEIEVEYKGKYSGLAQFGLYQGDYIVFDNYDDEFNWDEDGVVSQFLRNYFEGKPKFDEFERLCPIVDISKLKYNEYIEEK